MTDSHADEVAVAAAVASSSIDSTNSEAAKRKEVAEEAKVKGKQGRLSPISILKAPRPAIDTATRSTPREPPTPTTSTSTLGKRGRSPQDVFLQLLDRKDEPSKKRKAYRVRWKSDAELVAIKEIEARAEGGERHGEGISEAEEGEVFKKAAPKVQKILEWYDPLPLVIPFAYLQRDILSEDAKVVADVEEGALSDVAAERSPTDTVRSLPPEQIGLLRETVIVYLPEHLLYPHEETYFEYQQEGQQQPMIPPESQSGYRMQDPSNQAQPGQEHEAWIQQQQQAGPSRGIDDGFDSRRMAEQHVNHWAENGHAGGRRSSATDLEAQHASQYRSRSDSGNGERAKEGERRGPNQGLSTINEDAQAQPRDEQYSLPVPKTQSIQQRSASNPTKTSSAAAWRGESGSRSASLNDYSQKNGKGGGQQRKGASDTVCKFYRTPTGCTNRKCSFLHL